MCKRVTMTLTSHLYHQVWINSSLNTSSFVISPNERPHSKGQNMTSLASVQIWGHSIWDLTFTVGQDGWTTWTNIPPLAGILDQIWQYTTVTVLYKMNWSTSMYRLRLITPSGTDAPGTPAVVSWSEKSLHLRQPTQSSRTVQHHWTCFKGLCWATEGIFVDILNISVRQVVVPTCLETTIIIPVPKKSN